MDAHAWYEQDAARHREENRQTSLARAASGEGQLAQMVGSDKAKDAFFSGITALARGGLANARRPYLVGEKGPELMVPETNGTIIPNHKLRKLQEALRRKQVVPRARGGEMKAGGAPPVDDGGTDTSKQGWPGPGQAAAERAQNLAVADASLGSPESYGGGRRVVGPKLREGQLSMGEGGFDLSKPSFSNPVHVIRRMGQTWAGPGAGEEHKTLAQANQAFIRAGQGKALPGTIPGYDPVKGPELRLVADLNDKNLLQKAQADAIVGARMGKHLEDRVLRDYGVLTKGEDGQETLSLPPEIKRLILGYRPKNEDDVESFMKKIAPEGTKIKTLASWNDPKTGMAMRRQLLATTTDPAEQKRIKEEQVTPETLPWFEGRRAGTQPGAPNTQSLRQPTENGVVPGVLDRVTQLGKTLSYELQPSLRKAGVPAPTLESVRKERIAGRQRIWDEENNLRAGAPGAM